jgi:hypothetical protein
VWPAEDGELVSTSRSYPRSVCVFGAGLGQFPVLHRASACFLGGILLGVHLQLVHDCSWLWADWPGRGGRRDTGIDLVTEDRDGGLWAAHARRRNDESRTDLARIIMSEHAPGAAKTKAPQQQDFLWWAHLGSNQGPPACEAGALPLSYAPRGTNSSRKRRVFRCPPPAAFRACLRHPKFVRS